MEYFMGETFDKEKNKPYKKLDAAEKAAEKVKAAVFDLSLIHISEPTRH